MGFGNMVDWTVLAVGFDGIVIIIIELSIAQRATAKKILGSHVVQSQGSSYQPQQDKRAKAHGGWAMGLDLSW